MIYAHKILPYFLMPLTLAMLLLAAGFIPFGSDTPKLASALLGLKMSCGQSIHPQAAQRVGADVSRGLRGEISASGDE